MNEEQLLTLLQNSTEVILVQPHFKKAPKSKNHSQNLPLALLKFASYCEAHNIKYTLLYEEDFREDATVVRDPRTTILVTTSFTYYSSDVKRCNRSLRQHNICKRFNWNYWSRQMECKQLRGEQINALQQLTEEEAEQKGLFNPNKEQNI